MTRLIKAKYAGKCASCARPIARGESCIWRGRYHGIECASCDDRAWHPYGIGAAPAPDPDPDDDDAGDLRARLESDRRLARAGVTVVRFPSGESFIHCTCEDRPCCGCNS